MESFLPINILISSVTKYFAKSKEVTDVEKLMKKMQLN